MQQKDDSLIISTNKISPRTEVFVDLFDYNERTIRNVLNQTYRKGFDVIRLKISKTDQLDIVRELVRDTMLGFEIVREDENFCVVENIAEPSPEKYDVLLRKLFLTIKTEAEEILGEIQQNKKFNLKRRKDNKNFVDNYTNFIRRLVLKNKIKGSRDSYLLYYLISQLSLIHHAYYYMCAYLEKQKNNNLDLKVIELLEQANKLFCLFYDSFYKGDLNLAHDIQVKKKELVNEYLYPLLAENTGVNAVALYHIGEVIRTTQMASTVLFGFVDEEVK